MVQAAKRDAQAAVNIINGPSNKICQGTIEGHMFSTNF